MSWSCLRLHHRTRTACLQCHYSIAHEQLVSIRVPLPEHTRHTDRHELHTTDLTICNIFIEWKVFGEL